MDTVNSNCRGFSSAFLRLDFWPPMTPLLSLTGFMGRPPNLPYFLPTSCCSLGNTSSWAVRLSFFPSSDSCPLLNISRRVSSMRVLGFLGGGLGVSCMLLSSEKDDGERKNLCSLDCLDSPDEADPKLSCRLTRSVGGLMLSSASLFPTGVLQRALSSSSKTMTCSSCSCSCSCCDSSPPPLIRIMVLQ